MKISLIFCIYELISIVFTKDTFKIYLNPEVTCDAYLSMSKIDIIFLSNNILSYAEFSLKLIDEFNAEYKTFCYINKRKNYLFSNILESYCLFSPPKTTTSLHYAHNSIQYKEDYDFDFQFNTNIEINTIKCISFLEAKILQTIKLSFDHIADFKIKNNIATFTFYGLSKYIYKNYGINIDIYLYTDDGKREMKTAICQDNLKEIINGNSLYRIRFSCSVKISNNKYIKLEYYNSNHISGVPYNNKYLLFLLIDQSIINKNTNENIVDLTIYNIDFSKAESDGIFYINVNNGYTTSVYFIIPLTYPGGLKAICKMIEMDAKHNLGPNRKKYVVECMLDGEINNLPMIFEQRTIEVASNLKFLISGYFESNINCINGVAKEQNKENQKETSLYFLQINNYKSEFRNYNSFNLFNLYALSTKQVVYNDIVILNMKITKIDSNGENDDSLNVTCQYDEILQQISPLYSKISFNCVHETKGVVSDLILLSSPNFTSLPESYFLKSPIATDEQIKGNLIISAERENYNIPILFIPTKLKMKSCDDTGKFLIKGIISSSIFYEGGFYLKIRLPKQDKLKCFFNSNNNNLLQFGIICEYPLTFIGKTIKIEIQNVKYGNDENFIFWNFYPSENLFCNDDENEETNTPIVDITESSDIYTSINSEKDNISISENPSFEINTTDLTEDTSGEIIDSSIISDSNQTSQDLNNITDDIEISDNLTLDIKESDYFSDDSGQISDNKSELIIPSNNYDIPDNITYGFDISNDTYTDLISQSNDTNNENLTDINIIETDKNISFTETESEIEFSNTNSIESETIINSTENETFKIDNITKYENNSINESDLSNYTNKVITETITETKSLNTENEKSDFNSETTGISESSIDISNYIDYITNNTEIYEEVPSTTIYPETENITEYHKDITNESNYSLNDTIISNNSNERVDKISEASNQIVNTDENIIYDNDTIDESTYQNNISYIFENDTNSSGIEIEPSRIISINYTNESNEIDYIEITELFNETNETEYTNNSVNISNESEDISNINNESLNSAPDSFNQNIDTITDININITNNISENDKSTYSNFPEYSNYTNYTDNINNETINYQDNTSMPIFINDTIYINKTEFIINKTDFDINENNETSDIINQTDFGYDKINKSDAIIITEITEQSDTINESDFFYGNHSITNRTSEIYMSNDITYDIINYTEKTDNITYESTKINSINETYYNDIMNGSQNIDNSSFIENTDTIKLSESEIINKTEYKTDYLAENITDNIILDKNNSINESNITDIITNSILDSQQITINVSTDLIKENETNTLTNNEYSTIIESNILNETNETQFTTITSNIKSQDINNSDFINDSTDTIKENETNILTTDEFNNSISDTIKESNISNEPYGTEFATITTNIKSQDINNTDINNDSIDIIKENETNTLTTEEYNSSISDTIKETEISNETHGTQFNTITSNIESQDINNSYDSIIIESDKSRTDINSISDIPQSSINELNNTSDIINYSDTSEYNYDNISEASDVLVNNNTKQTENETNYKSDSPMIENITTNDTHESEDIQNKSDNITNYTFTIDSQQTTMETTNYITNNITINNETITTDSLSQKIEPSTNTNINNTSNLSENISETDISKNSITSEYSTYANYTENDTSNYKDNTSIPIFGDNTIDITSTEFISNETSDEVSQTDSYYDNGSITNNIPDINLTSDINNDQTNDTNNIAYTSTEINSMIETYNTDNINGSQNINQSNLIENTTTTEMPESNIANKTEYITNYLSENITHDIDINDSSDITKGTNILTTEEYINSTINNTIIESEISNETYETQFTINTSTIDSQYIKNSDINNDSNYITNENESNTLTTEEYNNSTINNTAIESEIPNETYETEFIINKSSIESQHIENSNNTIIIESDTSRIDIYNVTDISQSDININTHDTHNNIYYSDTTEYNNENISESSNILDYIFSDQTEYETNDNYVSSTIINTNTNGINESVSIDSDNLINTSEIYTEQASIINTTNYPVNNRSDISTISTQNFSDITDTENISANITGNYTIEPTMEPEKSEKESEDIYENSSSISENTVNVENSETNSDYSTTNEPTMKPEESEKESDDINQNSNSISENTVNAENSQTNSDYITTISQYIISDNSSNTMLDENETSKIEMNSSTLSSSSSDVYNGTSLINDTIFSSSIIIESTNINNENVSESINSDISQSININTEEETIYKDINTTSYTEKINPSETFSDINTNINEITDETFGSEKIDSSITVDSITPTEEISYNINLSENLTNTEELKTESQFISGTDTINLTKTDNSSTIENGSSKEIVIDTNNIYQTEVSNDASTNILEENSSNTIQYETITPSYTDYSTHITEDEVSDTKADESDKIQLSTNNIQNDSIDIPSDNTTQEETHSSELITTTSNEEKNETKIQTESISYYSEFSTIEINTESTSTITELEKLNNTNNPIASEETYKSDTSEFHTTVTSITNIEDSNSISSKTITDLITNIPSFTTEKTNDYSNDIFSTNLLENGTYSSTSILSNDNISNINNTYSEYSTSITDDKISDINSISIEETYDSENTEFKTIYPSITNDEDSDSINNTDTNINYSTNLSEHDTYNSTDILYNGTSFDTKNTDNMHIIEEITNREESFYSNEMIETETNESSEVSTTNDLINNEEEDYISFQSAKNKSNLTLSFRQINKFKTEENSIGFYLYCITTKDLDFDEPITISVNLIKKSGEKEELTKEAKCILIKSVFISKAYSAPAEFKCELSYIPGNEYYSLRYNNSEYISGVPNDEYALNPKLTEEKINKGEFIDYSLENNSMIIAPVFTFDIISVPPTKDNYIFSFNGTLSGALPHEINTNFTIPLSYPIGVTFSCWFDKDDIGFNNATISCISDRNLKNVSVIIEQNVIRKKGKDYFSLKSIEEHFDECTSGKLVQAVERLNIGHAFKEVSDYKFSKISYVLTFKLYTISSQIAEKNNSLNINMTITFKNESFFDKKANCSLFDYINKTNDFLFYENEYKCLLFLGGELSNSEEIDFNNPKTTVVSLKNNEISGINHLELTQRSPLGTDKLSNKIKGFSFPTKENDSNDTELIQLNLSLYNYNDLGKEINQGKIKILGSFSQDIIREINFDLPLDFPSINLKCRILNAKKYEKTDIICKNQKELRLFEDFVIEKKFIMKDNKILFFVDSTKIKFDETQHWNDYNKYRYQKAKKRLNSNYYFVDIINEPSPNNNEFSMLLGLKKTNNIIEPIPMKLNLINKNSNLRNLDIDLQMKELTAQCEPDLIKGDYAKFICSIPDNISNGKIKIEDYELNVDETEISGFLGRNNIKKSNISENNNKDELSGFNEAIKSINNTPIIEIDYINGDLCEKKGSYSIMGHITKNQKKALTYSNISIFLSSPDSIGICDITTIKDNNNTNTYIALNCLNQEKFSLSQILLESTVIKDNNGANIFRLNSFSSANCFSCSVGKKAEKETLATFIRKYIFPILLVVLSIVALVLLVAIISYCNYSKENAYLGKKPSTTTEKFDENDITQEFKH